MAFLSHQNCRISAISTSVPPILRKTEEFIDWLGYENVEKIKKNVGIHQGYISPSGMTTSDLCYNAAIRLLEATCVKPDQIDAIIFVSQTPDYIAPSTACLLQHRLKLSDGCLAFDINLACSGYIYGLNASMSLIGAEKLKKVLLLSGDTVSKHCSPKDKTLTVLSTDAGTATLVEFSENCTESLFSLGTMGEGFRNLIVPYGGYRHRIGNSDRTEREPDVFRNDYDGYMNGAEVFKFSITQVPKMIKEFQKFYNISQFSSHFFHQANSFIISNIAKRIGASSETVPVSIDRYGNTGAATVPLTICDALTGENNLELADSLICGFGIGLSLGVARVDLSETFTLPIAINTDTFDDGLLNLHAETKSFVRS